MLKTIIRAAVLLTAATTIAQAAQPTEAGRLTYVDASSGRVIVDNHTVMHVAPFDVKGLAVGTAVEVTYVTKFGRHAVTSIVAKAPAPATKAVEIGRVTHVDAAAGRLMVDSVPVPAAASVDLATLKVGQRIEVTYQLGGTGKLAIAAQPIGRTAVGRLTYVDPIAKTLLIDNVVFAMRATIDPAAFRVGQAVHAAMIDTAGTATVAAVSILR